MPTLQVTTVIYLVTNEFPVHEPSLLAHSLHRLLFTCRHLLHHETFKVAPVRDESRHVVQRLVGLVSAQQHQIEGALVVVEPFGTVEETERKRGVCPLIREVYILLPTEI